MTKAFLILCNTIVIAITTPTTIASSALWFGLPPTFSALYRPSSSAMAVLVRYWLVQIILARDKQHYSVLWRIQEGREENFLNLLLLHERLGAISSIIFSVLSIGVLMLRPASCIRYLLPCWFPSSSSMLDYENSIVESI